MDEQWKPIPGFPDYDVSNEGRIRSYKCHSGGDWCRAETPQRMLKPCGATGYLYVGLRRDGKTYNQPVAPLVLLAFVGRRPEGMDVCHNDGHRFHNHLDNLRYDTRLANMTDPRSGPTLLEATGRHTLKVRMAEDDLKKLEAIRKAYRVDTVSQVIRTIIRETSDRLHDREPWRAKKEDDPKGGTMIEPLEIDEWTDLEKFDEYEANKADGWSEDTIRAALAEIQRREGLLNA